VTLNTLSYYSVSFMILPLLAFILAGVWIVVVSVVMSRGSTASAGAPA
jgi:hypothetical protein